MNIIGDWITNKDLVFNNFSSNFPHLVIDNFLKDTVAEKIYNCFPKDLDKYHYYENPLEVKYANNNISEMHPEIRNVFEFLGGEKFCSLLKDMTGIEKLEKDPYLHGAGLHLYPRNGRLNIHLDYEKHPISGKQRRLNLILFLNKGWKKEYFGNLQLWNHDVTKILFEYSPDVFNRGIIFKTDEKSWHGLPEKIKCPKNIFRQSLAYYWVSDLIEKRDTSKHGSVDGYRIKAGFIPTPGEKNLEKISKLCQIRNTRKLNKEDLNNIFPEWNLEI